ncbi:MAG TPA: oligosaccharide flippase family protein [Polyangiaceae bacterium]|nr:oligosaccharide flippase family protein [Polyangiaceae bacterium]
MSARASEPPPSAASSAQRALSDDARALRRGAVTNGIGYAVAALQPPLLVLVVRAYGAESFGLYTAVNGLLWIALRVGLLGLDKGMLWWVARAGPAQAASAVRASLRWVLGASTLTALLIAGFLAPALARWADLEGAEPTLRAMAFGLIPLSLTELLLCIGLGQRRIGTKVFVRDGLLPTSFVGAALLGHVAGLSGADGLAAAFIVSHGVSAIGAFWALRSTLPGMLSGGAALWPPEPIPGELVRYTRSAFGAEFVNSISQRMDVLMVAALTDARTLGVWAAVMQVGNVVRTIRRSFDPIVVTTFAKIGAVPERRRLVHGFSHATRWILTAQTPVLLFLIAFAAPILGLFGDGFEVGRAALITLSVCWLFNGLVGLNGFVVSGFGRSDWLLIDIVLGTSAQALSARLLVPAFGLLGAAVSVAASQTFVCLLQAWQARRVAGTWAYERRVFRVFGLSVLSIGVLGLLLAALSSLEPRSASLGAFSVSTAAFALGLLRERRQKARSSEPAESSPQLG